MVKPPSPVSASPRPLVVVVKRPTGWWVTDAADRERYVAGPFETEAEALSYLPPKTI